MLQTETPPWPFDPFPELATSPLGGDGWIVDDRSVDYPGLAAMLAEMLSPMSTSSGVPSPPEGGEWDTNAGPSVAEFIYTTNDLWLEITGFTNCTASLVIHRAWNDTNAFHDLFYTTSLASPINWHLVQRCISTNVFVPDLCDAQGFFRLGLTNGSLTMTTNRTPMDLAQLLVPPWVMVTNATFAGSNVARGTFAGGHGCGLPIETGVILSSGPLTNAPGPNNDTGGIAQFIGADLGTNGDRNLDLLFGLTNATTRDAAMLKFDVVASNSFVLQFAYIFASEEYPEYLGRPAGYNDVMAIFVSTTYDGTNWIITTTNNIAQVPGTNQVISVNTINGGGMNATTLRICVSNQSAVLCRQRRSLLVNQSPYIQYSIRRHNRAPHSTDSDFSQRGASH